MSALTISAIMPVYNGKGYIERSLPPLLHAHERGEVVEVIVVDDGSDDGSGDWAREQGARVLRTAGRTGPGAARNLAVAEAVGEIVWFVDADVVVHDDAVAPLRRAFEAPGVVAVFGSYDDTPPFDAFASQYMNLRHHFFHHQNPGEASTFWSGCGAVRRDAFLAVEGFDAERYERPSIEDIELGYRLRGAGGRIVTDPTMQGTHLKEWTLPGVVHTDLFCRALPWSRLQLERPDEPLGLNASPGERLKAVLGAATLGATFLALVGLLPAFVAIGLLAAVWFANRELFELFRRRRGLVFAVGALAFHQVHLTYSGLAFAWCWLEHRLRPSAA